MLSNISHTYQTQALVLLCCTKVLRYCLVAIDHSWFLWGFGFIFVCGILRVLFVAADCLKRPLRNTAGGKTNYVLVLLYVDIVCLQILTQELRLHLVTAVALKIVYVFTESATFSGVMSKPFGMTSWYVFALCLSHFFWKALSDVFLSHPHPPYFQCLWHFCFIKSALKEKGDSGTTQIYFYLRFWREVKFCREEGGAHLKTDSQKSHI